MTSSEAIFKFNVIQGGQEERFTIKTAMKEGGISPVTRRAKQTQFQSCHVSLEGWVGGIIGKMCAVQLRRLRFGSQTPNVRWARKPFNPHMPKTETRDPGSNLDSYTGQIGALILKLMSSTPVFLEGFEVKPVPVSFDCDNQ